MLKSTTGATIIVNDTGIYIAALELHHTPAPICGTMNVPICLPATGNARHRPGGRRETADIRTIAMMRPISIGSTLLTTVPR